VTTPPATGGSPEEIEGLRRGCEVPATRRRSTASSSSRRFTATVGDDAQHPDLDADHDQDHGHDQRLHVPGRRVVGEVEVEEAGEQREPDQHRHGARAQEDPERVVEHHDAGDALERAQDIADIAAEQPRRSPWLRVDSNRHRHDAEPGLARLEDRLQGVGESREDVELERSQPRDGAEAGGGIAHRGPRQPPHDPRAEPLQQLLGQREVADGVHLAVADHHLGVAVEDRAHQNGNVAAVVLVVGVGVDDDVGAELHGAGQPAREGDRETAVDRQPENARPRRAATSAVPSDEPSSTSTEPLKPRPVGRVDRLAEVRLFVPRGFDDELNCQNGSTEAEIRL
jgi:hypothetical protein